MKAITLTAARRLAWTDVPDPALPAGHVRIRVRATAANRADLAQRAGTYPPPPGASEILGLECAGVVVEVADDVTAWAPGDRVCALLSGGGYAEQVVAPAGHLLPIPHDLSFEDAAALPEVLCTAYVNLYMEAGARPGERILLHAGASGVGTAAIQLCRAFGNPCFVTVGSEEKIRRCVALGAEGGRDRHHGPFADAVRAWSPDGVDVVLDPVGGAYVEEDLRCVARGGRIVVIGLLAGREARLDLGRVLMKRLRIVGSVLRSRSDDEKSEIVRRIHDDVWPLVARGEVRPIVDRVLDLPDAERALSTLARNETVGKVVLRVP